MARQPHVRSRRPVAAQEETIAGQVAAPRHAAGGAARRASGRPRRIDYPRAGRAGVLRYIPSWRLMLGLLTSMFLLMLLAVGVAYAAIAVPNLNPDISKSASIIYWSDGKTELGRFAEQNRVPVELSEVPEHVRNAVLAAEDRTFYENQGVSPKGIARAFLNNVRGGGQQGGSTITQQYVKNAYLTQERTLSRKGKEFVVALKVNRQQSKNEILEGYLNTIYWGRGAYGIEAASREYFGKSASKLTRSEGAYLAGIIQAPSRFELAKNKAGAERRWTYVLDGMLSQGWLTPEQRAQQRFPAVRKRPTQQRMGGPNGYLLDAVRQELGRQGLDDDEIEAGGLRVHTTFDRKAQAAAVKAVATQFPKKNAARVQVGLASVRPGDGAVVALYGGKDFLADQISAASEDRILLGSTVKPFTLAAGLREGRSLRSRYQGNSPIELPGGDKPVRNEFNNDYGERIDLYKAVEESVNTAFVDLTLDIGASKVKEVIEDAGLDKGSGTIGLNPDARVTLGTASSNPLAVANAFGTLAAGGVRVDPYVIVRVELANGGIRYEAKPKKRADVFGDKSRDIAADVSEALVGVVERGTGRAARELERPVTGKTGTAAENVGDKSYTLSAWFSGYTPQLATSVAYFRSGPSIKARSLDDVGRQGTFFGSRYPAETWTAYMIGALEGVPVAEFPKAPHLGEVKNAQPTLAPATPSNTPTTQQPSASPLPPPPSPSPSGTPSPQPTLTLPPPTTGPPTPPPPPPTPTVTPTITPPGGRPTRT